MWEAICLTLLATAGNNIGKVLQKKGTVILPPLSFKLKFLLNAVLRLYKNRRREQELIHYEVVEEIIVGLESGILFGLASVISKMGFLFSEQGHSRIFVPACISISICCSATGFVFQTRGLKHGRAIVVSTCAAVASIITGVLAGMLALGERLPLDPLPRLCLLLGWILIIVGVILLVSSARLIPLLPRPLRHFLQSSRERSHNLRRPGSLRPRDPSPGTIIQASALHPLIASPAKAKA